MKRALIVVAKKPAPGQTKTRLSPPLSPSEAVGLYECLLLDTLELMAQIKSAQPVIAFLPDDAEPYFRGIAPAGFCFVPQQGRDLGERLDQVLRSHLLDGYDQAVVMNSDGPTLPAAQLNEAFRRLEQPTTDVVLGPSEDGGYYLIGLKQPCAALFDVTMSTPQVLADTLALAAQHGLSASCLETWYDVDVRDDLARLLAHLDELPQHVARHTRRFLGELTATRPDWLSQTAEGG